MRYLIFALTTALFIGSQAAAYQEGGKPSTDAATAEDSVRAEIQADAITVPFFGNDTCPIMGKKINGEKFAEKDGERVYVCCTKCVRKVEADFEQAYATAYPAESLKDLKNAHCPIMGGETENATATTEFQGHLVHFCCAGCDRKFNNNPNRHLALLTAEETTGTALRVLGNKKCLVAPEADVAKDTFFVYKGVLIDAASADAVLAFKLTPDRYLKAAGVDIDKVGRPEEG